MPSDTGSPGIVTEEGNSGATDTESDAESPTTAEEFHNRAEEHAQNHEIQEAIADYTQAIQLDPGNLEYVVRRAELYGDVRDFSKAFEDSEEILKADPTNLRAHSLRGRMFELSGNPDAALIEFNKAVDQHPGDVTALGLRQLYFERQGQHDKALADGRKLIELRPDLSDGYLSQGTSHIASGEFEDAMKYSSAAIQKTPDNWSAYDLRAQSRAANSDFSGAMEDFNRALELSPDNAYVLSARSVLDRQMGDYQRSLADLEKAVTLEPQEYVFKALLADLLATCPEEQIRNAVKADEYAKDALKLAPNDPLVWNACAAAAAEKGNYDDAIRWSERGSSTISGRPSVRREAQRRLEVYKTHQPYRDDLAVLQQALTNLQDANDAIKNHKFDRAIALLSRLIAADPDDNTRVRNSVAWLLATCPETAIRDGKKASKLIDRSLELHPDDGAAWDTCAAVFAENGDFDHAISWENRYLNRKDVNETQRKGALERLALYKKHQPYREEPEHRSPTPQVSPSTTPKPTGK